MEVESDNSITIEGILSNTLHPIYFIRLFSAEMFSRCILEYPARVS